MNIREPDNATDGLTGFFGAWFAFVFGASPAPQDEEPPVERARITVLAIDDDPDFLVMIRRVLPAAGFKVFTAISGVKGLDMLRYCDADIQVVLLDYNMPVLNGAETLQHVRRLNPRIKIVAVTGMDLNSLPASFRDGVHRLVRKPFRGADLVATINAVLEDRPATSIAAAA